MYLAWAPDEGVISVSSTSFDFGTVNIGDSKGMPFYIKNVGNASLTVTDFELTDDVNYLRPPITVPFTLPPASQLAMTITFAPQSVGQFDAELTIRSTDIYHPQVTVSLTGQGVPGFWYVDASAASGGDGTSWGTAFQSISEAIAHPDVIDSARIQVRQGTYSGTVEVTKGVSIYGGYDDLGQRDWKENVTTITGNDSVSCMNISAAGTLLDGFTITDGNAVNGGGLIISQSNVTVANCKIENNEAAVAGGGTSRSIYLRSPADPATL
ncbi:MAG: choice-of-anchor D domain-containing protein [Planctomycetes bacterium]|nr:choice-of-anchor D domain-containing protein [Planctomycetota bacterium]